MFTSTTNSTLNSYGYSPHPLKSYLDWVYTLLTTRTPDGAPPTKPVIISITSARADELAGLVTAIQKLRSCIKAANASGTSELVAIELNTSCPNIKDAPPPSYNFPSLIPLLEVLAAVFRGDPSLTIGLKLPPYLYRTCFHDAIATVASFSRQVNGVTQNPFAFITCTNTLGSSLLFTDQITSAPASSSAISPALPTPLGGLGGEAIHPLALGNVYTFAQLLSQHADEAVRRIVIIGVGGVTSPAAAQRMFRAGAQVVECATLLGQQGMLAFQAIVED